MLLNFFRNQNEIEVLIESWSKQQKSPLSPENHFLSLQQLSPDEEVYINEQDQFRMKLYQDAKRKIAKKVAEKTPPISTGLSTLDALKEQQKVSRDENSEYVQKRVQNRP